MRKIFLTLVAAMTIALAPASLGAQTDNETQVKTEQTTTAKTVKPGEFAVFMPPRGAHAPCLSLDGPRRIRTVVVKVLAD